MVRALRAGDGERKEFGYNLDQGKPELREWDQALADAYAERARSALKFAHQLAARPDTAADDPQPEDVQLADVEETVFKALLATVSAARRLSLPIYTDDRDLRRRVRAEGLPAFGTLALVDALAEADFISAEQRGAARRSLLASRALGVKSTSDELVEMGRGTDWQPSVELDTVLLDAWLWGQDAAETFRAWVGFLQAVRRDAPQRLIWVARLLNGVRQARPEVPVAAWAQHLVVFALVSMEPDEALFTRAVIAALARARVYVPATLGDPVLAGLLAVVHLLAEHPQREAVARIIGRAWTRLPLDDQLRTMPFIFA